MLGSDSDSGSASCSLCDPRMTKGGKRNSVTSKRHSGAGSVSLNLDPQVDEPINFTSNLDSNLQNAPVVSWIPSNPLMYSVISLSTIHFYPGIHSHMT